MPELPEVNTFQQYFEASSLAQKIMDVQVHDGKIIRNMDADTFINKMTGRTFTGSYRRGKYLFAELDNDCHLLLHFGMTGDLKYYQEEEERPKHERFVFIFQNGFKLGFDCQRKFARILFLENLDAYIQEVSLGEDALRISEKDFLQKMDQRKTSIKGFLLNQKLLAGVGNLYADEICYQTRVHPASKVYALPNKQRKAIYKAMKGILEQAIDQATNYKDNSDNQFFQWRVDGQKAPNGKGQIKSEKIAGRTSYFFEGWQKFYE